MIMRISVFTMSCIFGLAAAGCAIAPLSSEVTARTGGEGNISSHMGLIWFHDKEAEKGEHKFQPIVGYAQMSYGLKDDLDVGVVAEIMGNNIVGATVHYAFLNEDQGWSWALLGGAGAGRVKGVDIVGGRGHTKTTGYYGHLGPIVSYKYSYVEPYLVYRLNYLHLNTKLDIESLNDKLSMPLGFGSSHLYSQLTLGNNFWLNSHLGLTLNINSFMMHGLHMTSPFFDTGLVLRY
jgi:hypothetical protein